MRLLTRTLLDKYGDKNHVLFTDRDGITNPLCILTDYTMTEFIKMYHDENKTVELTVPTIRKIADYLENNPFDARIHISNEYYEIVALMNDDWRTVTPDNDQIKQLGTYNDLDAAEYARNELVLEWITTKIKEDS